MYTSILQSIEQERAIMLRSNKQCNKPRLKPSNDDTRSESTHGTKSYSDALQRAFNNAKRQIFFNPDMQYFITLTYKQADNTIEQVLYDIKQFVKKERRRRSGAKYIYVLEYQKRGSIHVHMIANNFFTLVRNKNGYLSLKNWTKGFSSVLHITDFDSDFRSYKYLFKYMRKSQRIGQSFIHSSRNLGTYTKTYNYHDVEHLETVAQEITSTTVNGEKYKFIRTYLQKPDTINPQLITGDQKWQNVQEQLQSTKEPEKNLEKNS